MESQQQNTRGKPNEHGKADEHNPPRNYGNQSGKFATLAHADR
jgi:hypothetical protein